MGFSTAQMSDVDEALKRAKDPLRSCRERHGVTGAVEYRLRYNGLGELVTATIERAPNELTPAFIDESIKVIMGTVRFPATGEPGILNFTDLGQESAERAAELNAVQDRVQAEHEAKAKRNRWIVIAVLIVLGIVAVIQSATERQSDNASSTPSQVAPSTAPSDSWNTTGGPGCTTGCRCGNACIDCSKKCRK
jgi:hypothetical protein